MSETRIVTGLTHVDLAWKKDCTEMSELFDLFVLRVIDLCHRNPDYRYLLEQTWHLRGLAQRRPDLFETLRDLVHAGQLELASNQVSSIELNTVNGESIVRNMQLGRNWLLEHLSTLSESCAMIDTFGFSPQMPQILNQFGHRSLLADRLGAHFDRDVLRVRGLDGSELLVVGSDIKAPVHTDGYVNMILCREYKHFNQLFAAANLNSSPLQLTLVYTENETVPMERVEACMRESGLNYKFGYLREFLQRLEAQMNKFEVIDADLNPEFTGTFSLRHSLRLKNRLAENALLNLEKLDALLAAGHFSRRIEELWWEMAYVQFHDVLSGTHPTAIYRDCMQRLAQICSSANLLSEQILSPRETAAPDTATIWNGLCAQRICWFDVPLPPDWKSAGGVRIDGVPTLQTAIVNERLLVRASLNPMSASRLEILPGEQIQAEIPHQIQFLDNGFLRVEAGGRHMIDRIIDLTAQRTILQNCDDLLVLQGDSGCFQIEQPIDSEIAAGAGDYCISMYRTGPIQCLKIEGRFPENEYGRVEYELNLRLLDCEPTLRIDAKINWTAEHARLRLKLTAPMESSINDYEVPFGVTRRKPYGTRKTARGEWPAHRFVVMQDPSSDWGIALANRGVTGVEIMDGVLWTTLLRAPAYGEYTNLEPDDTTSDHGVHDFQFMLIPYSGDWRSADIACRAQEFNDPVFIVPCSTYKCESMLKCDSLGIMLSCVRTNIRNGTVLRFYETFGQNSNAIIKIPGIQAAYESDLREEKLAPIPINSCEIKLHFTPFEIKTILVNIHPESLSERSKIS